MPNEECEHLGYFNGEWYCKLDDGKLECEDCPSYSPFNDRCKTCNKRYNCFDTRRLACEEYQKEVKKES